MPIITTQIQSLDNSFDGGLYQKKLDELKNQMRGLDKALKLIYEEKASKSDLEKLKKSVEESKGA